VNGTLTLRATQCEIHGDSIAFEPEFANVGMWHGPRDHVVWRVRLEKPAEFDVYMDYACEASSAGNAFVIEGCDPQLKGTVAATGKGTWAVYRRVKLGSVKLDAGDGKLVFRPNGETLKGALLDLRTLELVPKGTPRPANER
jgi:hypothetical protein